MCINNIEQLNGNSIEFFLLTWTGSGFKLSQLEPYRGRKRNWARKLRTQEINRRKQQQNRKYL